MNVNVKMFENTNSWTTGPVNLTRLIFRPYENAIKPNLGYAKRSMDIAVSSILILLLLPIWVLVALAIKLDSRGPIFYSQARVGYKGQHFKFWKFRSMCIDADQKKQELLNKNDIQGNLLFKMKSDPRISRVGKFIRKYSIDELPQLWNVLIGDMSLVGPRPAVPGEVSQYTSDQRERLLAVPGITCIWQVSGRSEIPFEQQVKMDVDYIKNQSTWMDLKLLVLTIPAVLMAKGAY